MTVKHYWYIILSLVYMEPNSSTDFTLIYDQIFHQTLKSIQPKNISRVDLIPINTEDNNLQNITIRLQGINKDDVVILFTKCDVLFKQILLNQRLVLKYGMSLQDMQNTNHQLQNSFCLQLNQSLQRVLIALVSNIPNPQVVIITDEDKCGKNFFFTLKTSILSNQNGIGDFSHTYKKHIVYHKYYSQFKQNNTSFLDELKFIDFNVVILLTGQQIVPVILREASILGTVANAVTWIVPFYEDQLLLQQFPQKLVSFQLKEQNYYNTPYKSLFKAITEIMMLYQKLKNDRSREDISVQMYQTFQKVEQQQQQANDSLRLRILLRGNIEAISKAWKVFDQQELYIEENTIQTMYFSNETNLRHLRTVTVLDEPWTLERKDAYDQDRDICKTGLKCQKIVKRNNSTVYKPTCCVGYTIDLFILILKYTKLEYSMYIVEDGKYGGIEENGQWNGVISDVLSGKADMAIAALTVIENRAAVIDFSFEFLSIQLGIVYKPQMTKIDFINFEFLSLLTEKLLLALLVVVAGTLVLIYLFENVTCFFNSFTVKNTLQNYFSIFESLTYICGVTLQRDLGGLIPRRFGVKLAVIIFSFCMMVFVTNYTAMLAATSIQYVEKNPFLGLKDKRMRNPTNEFKFGTVKDTSYDIRFKFSENPVFRKMSRFMEKYNLDTPNEGVKKVASEEYQAFIYDVSVLTWLAQKHKFCELRLLQDEMLQAVNAYGMKRNFKWSHSINNAIEHYNENKKLAPIFHKWFPPGCPAPPLLAPRNINDFGGLILILCITSIFCIPILLIEHFYKRLFKRIDELRRVRRS